jgi:Glycosyl transferase family 64 domain
VNKKANILIVMASVSDESTLILLLDSIDVSIDDDLSSCKRGDEDSMETASMTQELVSSYSNDTQEEMPPANGQCFLICDIVPHELHVVHKLDDFAESGPPCWSNSTSGRIVHSVGTFLLLLCCLLQLSSPYGPIFGRPTRWPMPKRSGAMRLRQKIEKRLIQAQTKGVTMRLRGNRIELLHQSLEQHAYCGMIYQVQIDWTASQDSFPDTMLQHGSDKVVNAASAKISTDAVLLLDESIRLSCRDLERAYDEWKLDPARVVGFLPDHETYYALVSDQAVMVHRYYWTSWPTLDDEDDKCQHLALSAFVSALSDKSPAVIATKRTALFTSKLLRKASQDCLATLSHAVGMSSIPTMGTQFVGRR